MTPLLKTGLASLTLDGSVESETAAMLAPYAPKEAATATCSSAPESCRASSRCSTRADGRSPWTRLADGAVRLTLDAYAAVAKSMRSAKAPRHRIEA